MKKSRVTQVEGHSTKQLPSTLHKFQDHAKKRNTAELFQIKGD